MLKICDAHNDLLYKYKTKQNIQKYINKLPQNIEKIFCAYFSYNNSSASVFDMKKKFSYLLSEKCVRTIENAWFINKENFMSIIENDVFCATLCHNKNNALCGGAEDNGEITQLGNFIIQKLEKNNVIVDTAHMNEKSFWQFVHLTQKPIFNSHSGFYSIFSHNRNLKTSQINEIVSSGGYIGLAMYPKFFTNNSYGIGDIAKNIIWFWENFGTNTLGFGTDFNGINNYPTNLHNYFDLLTLAQKLIEFGANREDINKLFSENLLEFYKKIKA